MNYKNALGMFGKRYLDRQKEFSVIFGNIDFRNKSVIEIGAGREGFFLEKLMKRTENIIAADVSSYLLKELKKRVEVKTKVCKAERLPFRDKSFDVAISRWSAQHFDNIEKGINEMCRVAKSVLVILPNESGDQTKIKMIKYGKGYYHKREKRVNVIKNIIRRNGLSLKEKRLILRFKFADEKEAFSVLMATEFGNMLKNAKQKKLHKFLKNKRLITQGCSIIFGYG